MQTTDGKSGPPQAEVLALLKKLRALRKQIVSAPAACQSQIEKVHPDYRRSAENLLHYLALRRADLRPLQGRLSALGLSSLGRAESHVLATVDAVVGVLRQLAGRPPSTDDAIARVDFAEGSRLLAEHTRALLGPETPGRDVRIMVTMPAEAADDDTLVRQWLERGTECVRINCAHDDAARWLRMIQGLKRAEAAVGRSCRVVMDLAGPKLRTGPIEPGPAVLRIRPQRDAFGRVTAAARVWLTPADRMEPAPVAGVPVVPLSAPWLASLEPGEELRFTDARGSRRLWTIVERAQGGCWAEASKTCYVIPGIEVQRAQGSAGGVAMETTGFVGAVPGRENGITLHQGDRLLVKRSGDPGCPETRDRSGRVVKPAAVGCTIPEVFFDVKAGHSIWFDDGKIGGVVERVERNQVRVRIAHARPRGERLRVDKGINLPDSPLRLSALTGRDLEDLAFVAKHADVVELSFANTSKDVELLQERLAAYGDRQPAIVLKIETRRAFENLPEMLLTAMRSPCCGVMIARGDLAVECGFERLAEVQEEILWICEAAHVPVIWATQVLESLAKDGTPSRAEITDAAMGHRAECVMLNKGPHMLSAVRALDDILRRMRAHQTKKQSMLRQLRLAGALTGAPPPKKARRKSPLPRVPPRIASRAR